MTEGKQQSAFNLAVSVADSDWMLGLVGMVTKNIPISVLRAHLNAGPNGVINASAFVGDGSGLTGIGTGTGGIINTGSTTIGADSDISGVGVIALQTRGVTRLQVENLGAITVAGALTAGTLSDGTFSVTAGVITGAVSIDLGGTTLLASRSLIVDTGGGFDINLGVASGDDFSIDTSAFVVEGDTGRVGINTATPTNLFEIVGTLGSIDTNGIAINITSNSTSGANDPCRINGKRSREELVIADNDNILWLLGYGHDGTDTATIGAAIKFIVDGTVATDKIPTEILFQTAEGVLANDLSTKMVITPAGNVGIGNTNPTDPSGSLKFLHIGSSAQSNAALVIEDNTSAWSFHVNDSLRIGVDGSNKMFILPDGNVGIGASPLNILHVEGNNPGIIQRIVNTHATVPNGMLIDFSVAAPNDQTQYFLRGDDFGGAEFNIWSDGSFVQVSDERVKTFTGKPTGLLEKIMQHEVEEYYRNEDVNQKNHIGWSAQKTQLLFSHLIQEDPYPKEGHEARLMMYKIGMIPILEVGLQEHVNETRKSIQELAEENLSLKLRVEELEAT